MVERSGQEMPRPQEAAVPRGAGPARADGARTMDLVAGQEPVEPATATRPLRTATPHTQAAAGALRSLIAKRARSHLTESLVGYAPGDSAGSRLDHPCPWRLDRQGCWSGHATRA
jgi:hypothetical protein